MDTVVLIPAGGHGTRWKGEGHKCLCEVDDKGPLLLRTLAMLERYDCEVRVLSHDEKVRAVIPDVVIPRAHRWLSETLLETSHLWPEPGRVIWAYGDVVWFERSLNMLFSNLWGDVIWFGHPGEIVGVNIKHGGYDVMRSVLRKAVEGREQHKAVTHPIYSAWLGRPVQGIEDYGDPCFIRTTDGTTDVDTVEDQRRVAEYIRLLGAGRTREARELMAWSW